MTKPLTDLYIDDKPDDRIDDIEYLPTPQNMDWFIKEHEQEINNKLKEYQIMDLIKKIVEWIIGHKDTITTWIGFFFALVKALGDYISSGSITIWGILQAIFVFLIGWFTGKTLKK